MLYVKFKTFTSLKIQIKDGRNLAPNEHRIINHIESDELATQNIQNLDEGMMIERRDEK